MTSAVLLRVLRRQLAGASGVLVAAAAGAVFLSPALAKASPDQSAASANLTQPVQVTLTGLEPRTVTPSSTILVTGTLTNDGDDTITDLSVRFQRGDPLTTRDELTADTAEPSSADVAQAPFQELTNVVLEPGDPVPFTYTATAADLTLNADGVWGRAWAR